MTPNEHRYESMIYSLRTQINNLTAARRIDDETIRDLRSQITQLEKIANDLTTRVTDRLSTGISDALRHAINAE